MYTKQKASRKNTTICTSELNLPTDYRLLPLLNYEEDLAREVRMYSMNTNGQLACKWRQYIESLRTPNEIVLEMPTMWVKKDVVIFNWLLHLLTFCYSRVFNAQPSTRPVHDIRMKLTYVPGLASNGLMNPSPTDPQRIKKKFKKQSKANDASIGCWIWTIYIFFFSYFLRNKTKCISVYRSGMSVTQNYSCVNNPLFGTNHITTYECM